MTELNATLDTAAQKAYAASSDALRPVVDQLLAGMHKAVERLADVAAQAVDKVEMSGECLMDTQAKAVRGARSYVREKPLTAIGVAVASGFLLSWALRQR
jgi:ElaB/YqjD/DUF883 family membrane-anchored ribosome-binding protein